MSQKNLIAKSHNRINQRHIRLKKYFEKRQTTDQQSNEMNRPNWNGENLSSCPNTNTKTNSQQTHTKRDIKFIQVEQNHTIGT